MILRNYNGVIYEVARLKLNNGIAVDKVVQASGAHYEADSKLSRQHRLCVVGDYPGFDQVDDAVRKHFRMYAQVTLTVQIFQYGIGNRTDSHLQRCPILDERCNLFSDGCFDGRGLLGDELG